MIRLPFLARRRAAQQGPATLHLEGVKTKAIDTGRARLIVTGALFLLAFSVIAIRMVDVTILHEGGAPRAKQTAQADDAQTVRADIVDRNGVLLATSLPTKSLYAHPREIPD